MKRERVTLTVTVDLDPVPGWGNDVGDWERMLQHHLSSITPHYNPVVTRTTERDRIATAIESLHYDAPAARIAQATAARIARGGAA